MCFSSKYLFLIKKKENVKLFFFRVGITEPVPAFFFMKKIICQRDQLGIDDKNKIKNILDFFFSLR